MPRKGHIKKRETIADATYNSVVVTKFINTLMLDGKKSTAEGIMYGALEKAAEKLKVEPMALFEKAMENELTVTERETLKAFWFETMPVGAIARLKGISSAAVSDTLARAQEKLKKALRYAVLYQYDTLDEETVLPLAFAGARAVAAARNSRARETGERLRGLRAAQGLSRSALAGATGLAQGRVKAIEEGKPVYARELALLSAFYGVTVDSLICHEEKGRGV